MFVCVCVFLTLVENWLFPFHGSPSEAPKSESEANNEENSDSMSGSFGSLTIKEDAMEGEAEDEERFPTFPYERLKVSSTDPVEEIDVTNREVII